MKIKPLIILISAFIIGFASYYFLSFSHPSDESMKMFFEENRDDFEKLRLMFEEDKGCLDISYDETTSFHDYSKDEQEGDCQISDSRHNEYREFLKKLKISSRIKRDWSDRDKFILKTSGIRTDLAPNDYGSKVCEKGFVYSPNELAPIMESLNAPDLTGYKKLSGNWYLFSSTWHYRGE